MLEGHDRLNAGFDVAPNLGVNPLDAETDHDHVGQLGERAAEVARVLVNPVGHPDRHVLLTPHKALLDDVFANDLVHPVGDHGALIDHPGGEVREHRHHALVIAELLVIRQVSLEVDAGEAAGTADDRRVLRQHRHERLLRRLAALHHRLHDLRGVAGRFGQKVIVGQDLLGALRRGGGGRVELVVGHGVLDDADVLTGVGLYVDRVVRLVQGHHHVISEGRVQPPGHRDVLTVAVHHRERADEDVEFLRELSRLQNRVPLLLGEGPDGHLAAFPVFARDLNLGGEGGGHAADAQVPEAHLMELVHDLGDIHRALGHVEHLAVLAALRLGQAQEAVSDSEVGAGLAHARAVKAGHPLHLAITRVEPERHRVHLLGRHDLAQLSDADPHRGGHRRVDAPRLLHMPHHLRLRDGPRALKRVRYQRLRLGDARHRGVGHLVIVGLDLLTRFRDLLLARVELAQTINGTVHLTLEGEEIVNLDRLHSAKRGQRQGREGLRALVAEHHHRPLGEPGGAVGHRVRQGDHGFHPVAHPELGADRHRLVRLRRAGQDEDGAPLVRAAGVAVQSVRDALTVLDGGEVQNGEGRLRLTATANREPQVRRAHQVHGGVLPGQAVDEHHQMKGGSEVLTGRRIVGHRVVHPDRLAGRVVPRAAGGVVEGRFVDQLFDEVSADEVLGFLKGELGVLRFRSRLHRESDHLVQTRTGEALVHVPEDGPRDGRQVIPADGAQEARARPGGRLRDEPLLITHLDTYETAVLGSKDDLTRGVLPYPLRANRQNFRLLWGWFSSGRALGPQRAGSHLLIGDVRDLAADGAGQLRDREGQRVADSRHEMKHLVGSGNGEEADGEGITTNIVPRLTLRHGHDHAAAIIRQNYPAKTRRAVREHDPLVPFAHLGLPRSKIKTLRERRCSPIQPQGRLCPPLPRQAPIRSHAGCPLSRHPPRHPLSRPLWH